MRSTTATSTSTIAKSNAWRLSACGSAAGALLASRQLRRRRLGCMNRLKIATTLRAK
jgi:hypothetical protein